MSTTVRINEEVKQKLKIKSAKTGISQYDLLNDYVIRGLDADEKEKELTVQEIKELLSYDRKEENHYLDDVIGICRHE